MSQQAAAAKWDRLYLAALERGCDEDNAARLATLPFVALAVGQITVALVSLLATRVAG